MNLNLTVIKLRASVSAQGGSFAAFRHRHKLEDANTANILRCGFAHCAKLIASSRVFSSERFEDFGVFRYLPTSCRFQESTLSSSLRNSDDGFAHQACLLPAALPAVCSRHSACAAPVVLKPCLPCEDVESKPPLAHLPFYACYSLLATPGPFSASDAAPVHADPGRKTLFGG